MKKNLAISVVILVLLRLALPRLFEAEAINSVLAWLPLILVVSVGQMLVMISGGIDVSVGSILGCTAMGLGIVLSTNPHLPLPLVFVAGACLGLVLGSVNALFVGVAKIPPLIVTIGTLATFRGFAYLVGGGKTITGSMVPDSLLNLASSGINLGPILINWLLVLSLILALCIWLASNQLVPFRNLYAYGNQPEATHRRGIRANQVLFLAYGLSGLFAGIGGAMYLSRFGLVSPSTAGSGFELTVIAAVVLGGTKITGGFGTVPRVFLGALALSTLNVALSVLGIDANWQTLVYGVVLLLAVCGEGWLKQRRTAK